MDLLDRSISEIAAAVRERKVSCVELTRAALDRAHARDADLHAFLELFPDQAMARAKALDEQLGAATGHDAAAPGALGASLPLAGVPIALKDNICLEWGRTTCASKILANFHSPYSATAARKLIDAGAIVIGKTNLDEFAMGSSCESSAFGVTRNPHDLSRVPGGSSGGSAAAVAARFVPLALGSDTGGSIRQPAAMCGVVGLKPTYGRVSRFGLVAYASSLDQIGPLTMNVEDCALATAVLCGHDPRDTTSAPAELAAPLPAPAQLLELIRTAPASLRVGVPRAARGSTGNHPSVNDALERSIRALQSLGATVIDVELAHLDQAIAAYYIIATAEASSNLARFDGVRYGHRATPRPGEAGMSLDDMYARSRAEGFGPEVLRRIMLGTHVLSAGYADRYYHTALKVRRLIKDAYDAIFAKSSTRAGTDAPACDVILMPATPGPAFKIGEKVNDPLALYLEDVYTVGVNLAGLPAISLPAGSATVDGRPLPVGVQLIAPAFAEVQLLRAARSLEQALATASNP